jgi:hypothetical protein
VGPEPKLFGLAVENIPIVNIQEEFIAHRALLADAEFRKMLLSLRDPVETPYLIWLSVAPPRGKQKREAFSPMSLRRRWKTHFGCAGKEPPTFLTTACPGFWIRSTL